VAAIVVGIGVRLVFFVLTPTIYGVENTLLYVSNDVVSSAVDGWSTVWAAVASLAAYLVVATVTRRPAADEEPVPLPAPVVADFAATR
jgi:solute:Na+ symporter, SSS family